MAKKRKAEGRCYNGANRNKKMKKQEDDDRNRNPSMVVDTYIPDLPDPAVHQILSLLSPKLAARSSIVSKQWARIWDSLPVLVFDEDEKICTDSHRRKLFMNFIRNCLKRRKRDKCDLDKFGLRMRYNGGASTMNQCLSFAIERNVKELDICIIRRKMFGKLSRLCYLSSTVFSSAKSLTILKLEGVNLKESIHPMRLLSLKTMSLESVEFNSTSDFLHLVYGCPSIENLLVTSSTLGSPVDPKVHSISSLSLKSLEFTQCRRPVFKIEAMNIESLKLDGWADDIASCQKITSLDLFCTYLPCHYFNGLESRFPLLESLTLHKCWWEDAEHMNIFSQHLKRFVFFENYMQLKVSTNLPNLLQATFVFWDAVPSYLRLTYLGEFLKQFDCSRKTSLQVTDAKGIIFPEEIRNTWSPPFPTLKHLEVEISYTTAVNDYVLIDSLHWMAPSLEFLSIKQNSLVILSERT
ncbi:hypothetical protein M0R45_023548 [Rubus argutus]|uniref:F-box domain-containing protein n=1 Tax=Rubus argutus TaxID=59490 RepID=A0AAW1WSL9_RUBAR